MRCCRMKEIHQKIPLRNCNLFRAKYKQKLKWRNFKLHACHCSIHCLDVQRQTKIYCEFRCWCLAVVFRQDLQRNFVVISLAIQTLRLHLDPCAIASLISLDSLRYFCLIESGPVYPTIVLALVLLLWLLSLRHLRDHCCPLIWPSLHIPLLEHLEAAQNNLCRELKK